MDIEARNRAEELVTRRPAIKDELLDRAHKGELPGLEKAGITVEQFTGFFDGQNFEIAELPPPEVDLPGVEFDTRVEAVIREFDRPTILITDDTWVPADNPAMNAELETARSSLEKAIPRVGRVEFRNVAMDWGGTGWVVDKRIIVTNRHVAEIVAELDGRGSFQFTTTPAGVPAGARLDFKAEFGALDDTSEEIPLSAIRYLASTTQPDIALFEVAKGVKVPTPIALTTKALVKDSPVAVIGYPAYDSRSKGDAIERYFGDIYDVKRLAPGLVSQAAGSGESFFMHDATTLGGNSGSVVIDLGTGKAAGLHFAGRYLVGNYAVTADQLKRALKGLKVTITVPTELASLREKKDGSHKRSFFKVRKGYQPGFLGTGAKRVPFPDLGEAEDDLPVVTESSGRTGSVLHYTHFSVKHSSTRKVPFMTACNIDATKAKRIKRTDDQWFFDERIDRSLQLGEADYESTDIDRGHMVRREDPNWGTAAEARKANFDTFHYTNAAPQHRLLNRGHQQWLGLEDYVLDNSRTNGLKVSVFTGPILRDADRTLPNGVQVPDEFWKIIVAVDATTKKLRATGYVLSQGSFIEDITEGFTFGQYRTYQVPISQIADTTGYDLDQLAAADPLPDTEGLEAASASLPVIVPLDDLKNMVL